MQNNRRFEKEPSEFKERLVFINRVAKVVKGGKNFRFTALMVVGNENGKVIAGGPARAVLEMVGIRDIRTKSFGSNNPSNCVKATLNGLSQLRTAEEIAKLRGKSVDEILS